MLRNTSFTSGIKMKLKEIRDLVKGIDPQMSILDMEGEYLYKLAKNAKEGIVVEIGSWKGRSTIWLAKGSNQDVWAVDPTLAEEFFENLENAGVSHLVKAKRLTSRKMIELVPIVKIGLLFIDGDHSYKEVKFDFDNWSKFLIDGGTIALHDTIAYEGPRRIVVEDILGSSKWKIIRICGQIVAARKTNQSGFILLCWNLLMYTYWRLYSWLFMLLKKLPRGIKERLKR